MNGFAKKKKMAKDKTTPNKKLYLVETVSMFRMRYVIEAEEASHAEEDVILSTEGLEEFSQKHLDETIVSSRELSTTDYMDLFDIDNDYLSKWSDEEKMKFINRR